MEAARYAEGSLTSLGIHQAFHNLVTGGMYEKGPTPQLAKFMDNQTEYENMMIKNNLKDPFWMYAAGLQSQLAGLQYGYKLTATANGDPTYKSSWPI
eukprot:170540_1